MIGVENRVMIFFKHYEGDQERVKILCVQYWGWKQGKNFQIKNPGELGDENVDPKSLSVPWGAQTRTNLENWRLIYQTILKLRDEFKFYASLIYLLLILFLPSSPKIFHKIVFNATRMLTLLPCMKSNYIEDTKGAISMEQNKRLGVISGKMTIMKNKRADYEELLRADVSMGKKKSKLKKKILVSSLRSCIISLLYIYF